MKASNSIENKTYLWNYIYQNTECVDGEPDYISIASNLPIVEELFGSNNDETDLYFYHPDHLGSSSFISDVNGDVNQHLQYLPFGESFIDQQTNHSVRYTFSSKEKDSETGFGYFGARYYSSDLSVWLSVDPLSDKYPSMSSFMYCAGNPVMLVDPDGNSFDEWEINIETNKAKHISDKGGTEKQYIKYVDNNGKQVPKGSHVINGDGFNIDKNGNATNVKEDNKPFYDYYSHSSVSYSIFSSPKNEKGSMLGTTKTEPYNPEVGGQGGEEIDIKPVDVPEQYLLDLFPGKQPPDYSRNSSDSRYRAKKGEYFCPEKTYLQTINMYDTSWGPPYDFHGDMIYCGRTIRKCTAYVVVKRSFPDSLKKIYNK